MKLLQNTRIGTKIAALVILISMVGAAASVVFSVKMFEADNKYNALLANESRAAFLMARVNRFVNTVGYKTYIVTSVDGASKVAQEAAEAQDDAIENGLSTLDEIAGLIPQRADEIAAIKERIKEIGEISDHVIDLGMQNLNAEGVLAMQPADAQIKALAVDLTDFNTELFASVDEISAKLTKDTMDLITALLIGIGIAALAGIAGALLVATHGITKPLSKLREAMAALAAGKLSTVVDGQTRKDEVGQMAKTVQIFKDNAVEFERVVAEKKAAEARALEDRKIEMRKLADNFESAVGEIIRTVSSAATELEAAAGTLTTTAENTQELSTSVASASGQASANVQSVAVATEEMSSSISEISRQVQHSSQISTDAVNQAQKTTTQVNELSTAANRIGDVVELISSIAAQTNLLALNATIEAARAGDAGRGFAVVASEVKTLAEQTAKATGDIGEQIKGIQQATSEAVGAIKQISETIYRISEIGSAIAAAVEEQGAATQEITRNIQQAAQGTAHVASNIGDVQRGSIETGSASSQVLLSARSLSEESNRLSSEVGRFMDTVRAA